MKIKFTKTPCEEAAQWLDTQPDIETAWKVCHRGDWMWWALRYIDGQIPTKEMSVEFTNWCAVRAKNNVGDAAAYAAAHAADAAYAASYAADAAVYAAAHAAAYAADAAERLTQADWIREHIACPVLEEQK